MLDQSEVLVWQVSDFVAVFNQTLEFAYPQVTIAGELANFRVSKNRWVYFDLKDETSSVKFFGSVYALPGPLEDGMLLQVQGSPRLHPQFGFSITFSAIQPVGEGTIRRASNLLEAKLQAEGLFDEERKRPLPYPPHKIALVASGESAAFHDFIKIINARWGGITIELVDVQVQGEAAPAQIIRALEHINTESEAEVIVLTRGGGSHEDLAAFSHELVVRAVAASRIPTLVAIGHEIDVSLAELAADRRASTPSNAAEMLVPDKIHELETIENFQLQLENILANTFKQTRKLLHDTTRHLLEVTINNIGQANDVLLQNKRLLELLNPNVILKRGYALISQGDAYINTVQKLKVGDSVQLNLHDGSATAQISETKVL